MKRLLLLLASPSIAQENATTPGLLCILVVGQGGNASTYIRNLQWAVIDPLRSTVESRVFECTTGVFADQFERISACYASVNASCDYYLRTRPDITWAGPPPIAANAVVAKARSLLVANDTAVSRLTLSSKKRCDYRRYFHGAKAEIRARMRQSGFGACAIVDDQVAVVPRKYATAYFSQNENYPDPPKQPPSPKRRQRHAPGNFSLTIVTNSRSPYNDTWRLVPNETRTSHGLLLNNGTRNATAMRTFYVGYQGVDPDHYVSTCRLYGTKTWYGVLMSERNKGNYSIGKRAYKAEGLCCEARLTWRLVGRRVPFVITDLPCVLRAPPSLVDAYAAAPKLIC